MHSQGSARVRVVRSSLLRGQRLLPVARERRHSFLVDASYLREEFYFQLRVHLCEPPGRQIVLCACHGCSGLRFGCGWRGPPCARRVSCQIEIAFEARRHPDQMWVQDGISLQAWRWWLKKEKEWGTLNVMVRVMGG